MASCDPVETVPPLQSPLRILVIEDDPESLHLMGALLSLWGHEPRLTDNGFAGLQSAEEAMPDVVLLDLGLPGMDGFEVAPKLRALPGGGSVLIVAVTAFRGEHHRERAMQNGFDLYLMKPVDIETLRTVLSQASRAQGTPAPALG
jgi:two-component system, chemotaxis family, CheB/CheR fusion protein